MSDERNEPPSGYQIVTLHSGERILFGTDADPESEPFKDYIKKRWIGSRHADRL